MSDSKAYLLANSVKTNLVHNQTTVGRLTSNIISLPDPTVSKNHASIHQSSDGRFYLIDHSTVNGTFLNGSKLEPNKKYPIKHKDAIQFGKYPHLFNFYQSNPENQKKGKINLKDYCFELDSQEDESHEKGEVKGKQSVSPVGREQSNLINSRKGQVYDRVQLDVSPSPPSRQPKAVKIPNLADYLELQGSLLSSNPSVAIPKPKDSKFGRQTKLSLPSMQENFNDDDFKKLKVQQQTRKNLFLQQQADKRDREDRTRALQQQKIRLEIERHKQEQEMLRRQIELQQKVRDEQERMEAEKKQVQEQLVQREKERRQKERRAEEQQKQKQKKFIEQLQQQKQAELQQIRQQQESLRFKSQATMRQQLQLRKKQLQSEAQALATQYEQIYRDTIKKMKNDIEKQQQQIYQLQKNIERSKEERADLQLKNRQIVQTVEYSQKQYDSVAGRNKAFILYASELQNRLDKMKEQRGESSQKKGNAKIKEDIESSRKLLSMKRGELKSLEEEIGKLRLSLNLDKRMGHTDMLETILQNHQAIQQSKYLYFQYLRQQKALKQLWQLSLEQNQHLQHQNSAFQKDIQNSKKQLLVNLKDNSSRFTQQRLHMLKCLHYIPQDKKRAVKLLIEEMVSMEQEIGDMISDSQSTHNVINSLILDSERHRLDNLYLSQLLFGADSMAHHFDNMKIQINELIQRIEMERDETRVGKRLKLSEDIENNEVKIYENSKKLEGMKNRWREGLRGQKVMLAEKNPIVFFGDLLAKKEGELQNLQSRTSQLERQYAEATIEIETLQKRKAGLSNSLESFKREQLSKIREGLM